MRNTILFLGLLLILSCCSNEGEKLPSFSLTTLDGKTISEQDLAGKITIINVWATWCGNCLNELSALNQLSAKYQGDSTVVFLALADESPEIVAAFLRRKAFNYTHIPDGTKLTDAIQTRLVKTYPQHIVLDRDLKIAFEATGELGGAVSVLSKEIEQLR